MRSQNLVKHVVEIGEDNLQEFITAENKIRPFRAEDCVEIKTLK